MVYNHLIKGENMSVLKVTSHGIDFNVRMVYEGDTYGLDDQFIHKQQDPLVEFYDTRYPHTRYGQFVSRYYLSTLLERTENKGLCLDGGIADWRIEAGSMNIVNNWLNSQQQKPSQKKKM